MFTSLFRAITLLLALVLSLALILVGCGSGGNGGGTPLPSPTAVPLLTSGGAGSVDLPIADPIAKVYAIAVVSDAIMDDATRGQFTIALDGGDQNKRLRNLCSSPLASDGAIGTALSAFLVCDSANVWLFLPGDDGDDLPEDLPADFAINSCSVSGVCAAGGGDANALGGLNYPAAPDQTTPLERMLTYRLEVAAPDSAEWELHADEIDFPRLPTGIQTRLRRSSDTAGAPNDEGGPRVTDSDGNLVEKVGEGYYLLYSPDPTRLQAQFDVRILFSLGFRIDDGGLTTTLAFDFSGDCKTSLEGIEPVELFSNTPLSEAISSSLGEHASTIYCVYTDAFGLSQGLTNPAASDNVQFTLNPPPYE